MSQSRSRKAPAVGGDAGLRARPSHTKASGDTVTPHPQRQNQRSKSKSKSSKVPKALRYDLENALVGLCNVWFEDIKPHLVRNNIKVHVHSGDAGAGDNRQDQLPSGAPGCSHLDPVVQIQNWRIPEDGQQHSLSTHIQSNCDRQCLPSVLMSSSGRPSADNYDATTASSCELCRLLFNASNSIESAVSQAASATLPAPLATLFNSETTTNAGTGVYSSNSPRAQSRKRRAPPFPPPSLLSSTLRRQPTQPYPNHEERTSVKVRMRQRQAASPSPPNSEFIGLVPRVCHTYSIPSTISQPRRTSNVTRPKKNDKKKKIIKKEDKGTQTEHISQRRLSVILPHVTHSQKHFHKSRATTAFYPPRRKKSRNSGPIRSKESQLCPRHEDKNLKFLYLNTTKEEYPSVMNLVRSPKVRRKQVGSKTLKPWK